MRDYVGGYIGDYDKLRGILGVWTLNPTIQKDTRSLDHILKSDDPESPVPFN